VSTNVTDGVIEIKVADQGIGIAEGELERIFERFYRVDPARSRETGGTGLGLSIVKHVAKNHGGEVTVWSKQGVGSTFALRLPVFLGSDEISNEEEIAG
jgi:two-component system sensor histidine kinase SenX3